MIRKFERPDTNEVIRIWIKASLLSHHSAGAGYRRGKAEEMIKLYLPRSETYVWQDNSSDRIFGFVSLVKNHIAALLVEPCMQGRGIGKELLDYAKVLHRNVRLNVHKENTASVAFYQRHGFLPIRERVEPKTGHTEILMAYSGPLVG